MPDQDDLTWPRREPDNWRGVQITRKDARDLIDAADASAGADFAELTNALDEVQGDAEQAPVYLLIKIVPSEI